MKVNYVLIYKEHLTDAQMCINHCKSLQAAQDEAARMIDQFKYWGGGPVPVAVSASKWTAAGKYAGDAFPAIEYPENLYIEYARENGAQGTDIIRICRESRRNRRRHSCPDSAGSHERSEVYKMGYITKGTIISMMSRVHLGDLGIDFPQRVSGMRYKYGLHFANVKRFYIVIASPSNNGNCIIKDSRGRKSWFNVCTNEFIIEKTED